MSEVPARPGSADAVDTLLQARLAECDAVAGTIAPVLRHMLVGAHGSILSDEIIAHVRGMIGDLARQLLDARASGGAAAAPCEHPEPEVSALATALAGSEPMLRHLHALALEWRLAEDLRERLRLDPVVSPLLQALIASPDPAVAELAMHYLAAQARFCQTQRRMALPLGELPGDLLHSALLTMRAAACGDTRTDDLAASAEAGIREHYDESRSRLGLISRLVTEMGGGAVAALVLGHGGVALFLSALAFASMQDRDAVALSTDETQAPRFALGLHAAGLKDGAAQEQWLAVYPDLPWPEGLAGLGAERAASLLASAAGCPGP